MVGAEDRLTKEKSLSMIKKLKKSGLMVSPCLSPIVMLNYKVLPPGVRMQYSRFPYWLMIF